MSLFFSFQILKLIPDADSAVKVFQLLHEMAADQRSLFFEQALAYDGEKMDIVELLLDSIKDHTSDSSLDGPSTSASTSTACSVSESRAMEIANKLLEEHSAYDRFAEDISFEEDDHLDFPLIDEERLLLEYINVLGL